MPNLRHDLRQEQIQEHRPEIKISSLGLDTLLKIREDWDNRLKNDPLIFVPEAERISVTPAQAELENKKFGMFAASYLQSIFLQSILKEVSTADFERRVREERILLSVGYGLGHDYDDYVPHACLAGLRCVIIDVSQYSCALARARMDAQWEKITPGIKSLIKRPLVICAEIGSALTDLGSLLIKPEDVEIWYLCRLLGCLERRRMGEILRFIGSASLSVNAYPLNVNRVVVINALKDCNCGSREKTSRLIHRHEMKKCLEEGAGRQVEEQNPETYSFFSKRVSALTYAASQ